MTDHLDQAVEAGRRAAEEITTAQLRETGNTVDFQIIARARAKAIIASILDLSADTKQWLAWCDDSTEPYDAGILEGYRQALNTIRQRAGLEE